MRTHIITIIRDIWMSVCVAAKWVIAWRQHQHSSHHLSAFLWWHSISAPTNPQHKFSKPPEANFAYHRTRAIDCVNVRSQFELLIKCYQLLTRKIMHDCMEFSVRCQSACPYNRVNIITILSERIVCWIWGALVRLFNNNYVRNIHICNM